MKPSQEDWVRPWSLQLVAVGKAWCGSWCRGLGRGIRDLQYGQSLKLGRWGTCLRDSCWGDWLTTVRLHFHLARHRSASLRGFKFSLQRVCPAPGFVQLLVRCFPSLPFFLLAHSLSFRRLLLPSFLCPLGLLCCSLLSFFFLLNLLPQGRLFLLQQAQLFQIFLARDVLCKGRLGGWASRRGLIFLLSSLAHSRCRDSIRVWDRPCLGQLCLAFPDCCQCQSAISRRFSFDPSSVSNLSISFSKSSSIVSSPGQLKIATATGKKGETGKSLRLYIVRFTARVATPTVYSRSARPKFQAIGRLSLVVRLFVRLMGVFRFHTSSWVWNLCILTSNFPKMEGNHSNSRQQAWVESQSRSRFRNLAEQIHGQRATNQRMVQNALQATPALRSSSLTSFKVAFAWQEVQPNQDQITHVSEPASSGHHPYEPGQP